MSNEASGREVILSVRHVDISFEVGHKKKFDAVKDANFDIYRGETFALVGESGSGKTTLGRAILRINPCSAGEILFEGERISGKISREADRSVVRNIQMIFQDPAASLNERATIEYCISEGLYNFHLYENEEDRIAKVDRALESVGLLPEHKSRYPHEFSGGQRQRVGIARAMIMDPKFIVADEPISALDVSIRAQVLNLMNRLKAEKNLTYLFIAHDLSVVRFIADRIAVIHRGEIVEIAESETLFRYPIHPYTISLLPSSTSRARRARCARSAPATSSTPPRRNSRSTRRSSQRWRLSAGRCEAPPTRAEKGNITFCGRGIAPPAFCFPLHARFAGAAPSTHRIPRPAPGRRGEGELPRAAREAGLGHVGPYRGTPFRHARRGGACPSRALPGSSSGRAVSAVCGAD